MSIVTTTLKRLSICPCGFQALKEEIKLGTEYEIDPERAIPVIFQCGGCGLSQNLIAVYIAARPDCPEGYLPLKLFEDDPEKVITA